MIPKRRESLALLGWTVLILIINASSAIAQTSSIDSVRGVDICAVLQDPRSFDGQIIHFRGSLDFEFEANLVNDEPCGLSLFHTAIWWDYGDKSTALWGPDAKRVRALTKSIVKNAEFEEFNAHARGRRSVRPDGQPCHNLRECAYYDVSATFTGRFYAGKMQPYGRLGGFGHMGCCHLFVIEQVADVIANPTPIPPENQRFACTTLNWQSEFQRVSTTGSNPLKAFAAQFAASKQFLVNQARIHDGDAQAEAIESDSLDRFGDLGGAGWSSRDLLTSYRIEFPQPDYSKAAKRHQAQLEGGDIPVTVVKEHCEPVSE